MSTHKLMLIIVINCVNQYIRQRSLVVIFGSVKVQNGSLVNTIEKDLI